MNELSLPTITITKEKYEELLAAANDGNNLKRLIHEKAHSFDSIDNKELRLLDNLYFDQESEE